MLIGITKHRPGENISAVRANENISQADCRKYFSVNERKVYMKSIS